MSQCKKNLKVSFIKTGFLKCKKKTLIKTNTVGECKITFVPQYCS